jgi:hypothetical protein
MGLDYVKDLARPFAMAGDSIHFWTDRWKNEPLNLLAPELFTFVKREQLTVQKVANINDFSELFQLPLSQIDFQQMLEVQGMLNDLVLNKDNDRWVYNGGSETFSANMIYRALVGHSDVHPVFKWLWKNRAQPKHSLFLAPDQGQA